MTDKINNSETKKTRLRLSERLKLVASFVPEGSRVADIGTDHGYVPIYLAETGKIKSALAMDCLLYTSIAKMKRYCKVTFRHKSGVT